VRSAAGVNLHVESFAAEVEVASCRCEIKSVSWWSHEYPVGDSGNETCRTVIIVNSRTYMVTLRGNKQFDKWGTGHPDAIHTHAHSAIN